MNTQLKHFIATCEVATLFIQKTKRKLYWVMKFQTDLVESRFWHFRVEQRLDRIWPDGKPNRHWNRCSDAETVCKMGNSRWDCHGLWKEFSQFCQRKKTEHTKSSPQHHQSNGKSGSAVKIAKSLLRKSQKTALNPYEALLYQRNTPTVGMTTSPTQRFLNRRTRTEMPMKGTLLTLELRRRES